MATLVRVAPHLRPTPASASEGKGLKEQRARAVGPPTPSPCQLRPQLPGDLTVSQEGALGLDSGGVLACRLLAEPVFPL